MTPEEINIAIVKKLGWKHFGCTGCACNPCVCNEWLNLDLNVVKIPNFYGDLNECAKIENTLTQEERQRYVSILGQSHGLVLWFHITATAPLRCRAFLEVFGLWKE